jgi:hypothetical protein
VPSAGTRLLKLSEDPESNGPDPAGH